MALMRNCLKFIARTLSVKFYSVQVWASLLNRRATRDVLDYLALIWCVEKTLKWKLAYCTQSIHLFLKIVHEKILCDRLDLIFRPLLLPKIRRKINLKDPTEHEAWAIPSITFHLKQKLKLRADFRKFSYEFPFSSIFIFLVHMSIAGKRKLFKISKLSAKFNFHSQNRIHWLRVAWDEMFALAFAIWI